MKETDGQSQASAPLARWQQLTAQFPSLGLSIETAVCLVFTAFFLFYGLVPIFGGDGLGLVGADEPRYAQIAREMLTRHDYITPILYGKPWLEKPALYYWRAMFSFKEFGVHDWAARLPSASFAFILISLIYLHIRRFRPGGQLDAALITASCAGIIAFARGASTDMQLAAPFCIGMLGWYAWYETDKKFWLFDLYFFNGAATLAKGPVAPFLAMAIIFAFIALRREWSLLRRTIWVPGILLYLAMVLPWYIAVSRRNPQFLRVFFLEHNLERFATNLYEHEQPIWYYLAVMVLALMPWTVVAIRALVDAAIESVNEWRARLAKNRYVSHARWGDAFPEFLVLWTLFPIVFFSLSRSKLPGYILPSLPPLTILTGDYLNRLRQAEKGIRSWLLVLHALLAGATVTLVLLLPWIVFHASGGIPPVRVMTSAIVTGIASVVLILVVVGKFGVKRLRIATMVPLVVLVFFLFGVGPFFGLPGIRQTKRTIQLIDVTYSARPLARQLSQMTPHEPVAILRVRRDLEFGLSFYRDHRVLDYEKDGVPPEAHILVVRDIALPELKTLLATRSYRPLFAYPAQHVSVYQVDALGTDSTTASPHK
ncbi:MAG TPA: glycosyltransferase family 39 protein [Acidobacteriaceae bacterium]